MNKISNRNNITLISTVVKRLTAESLRFKIKMPVVKSQTSKKIVAEKPGGENYTQKIFWRKVRRENYYIKTFRRKVRGQKKTYKKI